MTDDDEEEATLRDLLSTMPSKDTADSSYAKIMASVNAATRATRRLVKSNNETVK